MFSQRFDLICLARYATLGLMIGATLGAFYAGSDSQAVYFGGLIGAAVALAVKIVLVGDSEGN